MIVPDKPMEFPDSSQRDWEDREYEAECPYRHTAEGCLWYITAAWQRTQLSGSRWRLSVYDDDGSHSFYSGTTLKTMQASAKQAIETHIRREHQHG